MTDKYDERAEKIFLMWDSVMSALIARLEAAERICDHIMDNGIPKSMRDKAYDYMNVWRKAAGKS